MEASLGVGMLKVGGMARTQNPFLGEWEPASDDKPAWFIAKIVDTSA